MPEQPPPRMPNHAHRPRESAPEWVRDEILKWIEQGEYKPADPLPSERELQVMFGVSRVVVREAIVRLQAVGLVNVRHGSGSSVSATLPELMRGPFRAWLELNRDEVVNLLKLRRALDGLAAQEAATTADDCAIQEMTEREDAFASAVASGEDPARLAALDKELHVAIAQASGVLIVAHLLGDLDTNSANIHRTSMAMPGRPATSVRDHRDILAAIKDGNAMRARRAAERHVEGSIAQIQAVLAIQAGTSAGSS